ncbi:hypothetical protein PCCS19_33680 [Paenibacillus sp. CCS19]|uniref:hypothetical protein n=1 Tax=Paenibacillus sp. CCS19 TaxID=3158387 RepID=UPI00256058F6|nr:hypothetical protein [Paenibacillus cellulosilyticus]GMK40312.1 hypothetical protein PCCS19_33680 [Paenibacillus cellulosilyticus]
MVKRNNNRGTGVDKLDHRVTVLLKEWAGLSGFYGYKEFGLEEVLALLNTAGWKTDVDASDPAARVVVQFKDGSVVRRSKFTLDEKGRALKVY